MNFSLNFFRFYLYFARRAKSTYAVVFRVWNPTSIVKSAKSIFEKQTNINLKRKKEGKMTEYTSTVSIVRMRFWHCCFVAFTLCGVFLLETAANAVSLDLFRNKDVLATRTIPDLTALKFASVTGQRDDYFNKLLAAWDTLQFDRTFISRGECEKVFISFKSYP